MAELYRVLFSAYNDQAHYLSDEMELEAARELKNKCLSVGYKVVYIIKVVE